MKYKEFKRQFLVASKLQQEKIKFLRNQENIVGLSGGKDSVATSIILHWLEIPFRTITAEVWWKEGITGENPYHFEFLHDTLFSKLGAWGVSCDTVRSEITAYEYMTTPIAYSKNHPERIGKLRGFPLCGKCGIQRDCKSKPCNRYYKSISKKDYTVILGIASDEKDRILTHNNHDRISVLDLIDIQEHETYPICASQKLLSPSYKFSERGGCWFCPNQKIYELEILYRVFPKLWCDLMEIQDMPNKIQEKFNRTQTLYDIEAQIKNGVQTKWFSGTFY